LKPIRFHDLRHTFGTLAVQVFPLSDVKAYMGHADIATTVVYGQHVPQLDAAEKLSRAVAGAAAPGSPRARGQGAAGAWRRWAVAVLAGGFRERAAASSAWLRT